MSSLNAPTPLLQVRQLTAAFQTDSGLHRAVDEVSFELSRGECLGIVGESGCGKSVTAMSLVRLLPQPEGKIMGGEVLFDGDDVLRMKAKQLHALRGGQVGVIFQEPMNALNPVLTIGAQIAETLILHRGLSYAEAEAEAVQLLKNLRIPAAQERIHDYPHQLSGGMRQRVLIAIALACRPKLIIADEPTTALDVTVQQQILKIIQEAREELDAACLLITHDLGIIAQNCDRVLVMYAGRVVESAPVEQLFAAPKHAYTRALLASMPRLNHPHKSVLPTIAGQVAAISDYVEGCRFCQRLGRLESELKLRPEMLEVAPMHFVEACPHCCRIDSAPAEENEC